ncbi:hypothetical protein Tco_0609338 [Tanacetum coccineum]
MVDKLQMVELDTVSAESCMREWFRESLSHFSNFFSIFFIVFEESIQLIKGYTVKIAYLFSCCDKPTPLRLKMIHKLRVDLNRCHRHRNRVHVIDQLSISQIFFDAIPYFLYSLIVVDESVDVNWQSKKKYFDSFDVTVIT